MYCRPYFSASHIAVFNSCQRKWAYQYIDNIKPPSSPAASFGLSVHKTLENYLITNKIKYETKEGRVASPGLIFLSNRKLPKGQVEKYFNLKKNGFPFHGYVDFYNGVESQNLLKGNFQNSHLFSASNTKTYFFENVGSQTWELEVSHA